MIPSLLQIPSAVSDSKLHSVLPNNGKGDFQFERSTGATRINRDGLIEEVGYFSSELVQNGDFSELGSELVTNGDFSNGSTGFDLFGVAALDNNVIDFIDNGSNTYSGIRQDISSIAGKQYEVKITVTNWVQGSVLAVFSSNNANFNVNGNGVYTVYISAVSTGNDIEISRDFATGANFSYSISNVSVKQVDPNDRWTLGTGWSYGTNKANANTSGNFVNLTQNNVFESGKTYKVKFSITDYTQGEVRLTQAGIDVSGSHNSVGTFTATYTSANTDGRLIMQGLNSFIGSINNISVVEVQGDRPRLSYDITNGVVEDKPHLLLEPSRTNLFNYSEPTTNEGAATGVTYESFSWRLGFSNCIKYGDNSVVRFRYGAFVSASTEYTLSAFVIMDDLSEPLVGVNTVTGDFTFVCGGATGGVANENIYYGNNIYRVSTTLTSGTNAGNNGIIKYTGQSSKGFRVVGLQVEAGSYSTSYIPTAGTTITRAAETCNNSKPSINSTEGVLYAEIQALASDSTAKEITISDGTTNNRVIISYNTANQIRINYRNSSSNIFDQSNSSTITDFHKIAVKWKVNDFSFYLDGSEVASSTSGSVMSANTLTTASFDDGAGTFDFYGKVKGLAVYNEALSESQLMQLTGVTASSIYSNFVTRTASFTVEALNEVKKVIDNL